jgi:hypothetical protein
MGRMSEDTFFEKFEFAVYLLVFVVGTVVTGTLSWVLTIVPFFQKWWVSWAIGLGIGLSFSTLLRVLADMIVSLARSKSIAVKLGDALAFGLLCAMGGFIFALLLTNLLGFNWTGVDTYVKKNFSVYHQFQDRGQLFLYRFGADYRLEVRVREEAIRLAITRVEVRKPSEAFGDVVLVREVPWGKVISGKTSLSGRAQDRVIISFPVEESERLQNATVAVEYEMARFAGFGHFQNAVGDLNFTLPAEIRSLGDKKR